MIYISSFYISSLVYISSSLICFIFGLKNLQAFKRTQNRYSKNMAIAIFAIAISLLSFGLSPFWQSQEIYKISLITGYIFLFIAFEYFFIISFGYLNLQRTAIAIRILFLFWVIPIIILFSLNFANPLVDKYGFIFWNYRFPLNWTAFLFIFMATFLNFLIYLKIARESQEYFLKLRSLFIAISFLFAGCGGAFTSLTPPGNYYSISIAYSGLFLGFISLLLAIYYKRAEIKEKAVH